MVSAFLRIFAGITADLAPVQSWIDYSHLCLFVFSGPPFTHQRTPQKMVYYGKATCKNNYENYIEIIKYVFSSYKRESPLIVNTMGWVTGRPTDTHPAGPGWAV